MRTLLAIPEPWWRSAQERWMRHLGQAVINVSAPVLAASFRRSIWTFLAVWSQSTHPEVPQHALKAPLRGISFNVPVCRRADRGGSMMPAPLLSRQGSWKVTTSSPPRSLKWPLSSPSVIISTRVLTFKPVPTEREGIQVPPCRGALRAEGHHLLDPRVPGRLTFSWANLENSASSPAQ